MPFHRPCRLPSDSTETGLASIGLSPCPLHPWAIVPSKPAECKNTTNLHRSKFATAKLQRLNHPPVGPSPTLSARYQSSTAQYSMAQPGPVTQTRQPLDIPIGLELGNGRLQSTLECCLRSRRSWLRLIATVKGLDVLDLSAGFPVRAQLQDMTQSCHPDCRGRDTTLCQVFGLREPSAG
jgi:hypothetical protein